MLGRLFFLTLFVVAAVLTFGSVQVNNSLSAAVWGFNAGVWLLLFVFFTLIPTKGRMR